MRSRGVAFKLILLICLSGTVIFAIVFGYNYSVTRKIVLANVEENARNLAFGTVNRTESVITPIEKVPESLARFLECGECDGEAMLMQLKAAIEENPEIFGGTVAFEPFAFNKDSLYFAPYYYWEGDKVKLTYLGGEKYRYFYWDWYQIPATLYKPLWSEPYFDEGGGEIVMSTYSVPFYRRESGERKFSGIVTADISLTWLQAIVDSIKIYQSGYGFLISRNGTIVTHPSHDYIMNETIFSLAETAGDSALREIGRRMIKGEQGFVQVTSLFTGEPSWLCFVPLRSSGWSLGVLIPEEELMADVTKLSRRLLLIALAGMALLLIAVAVISTDITKPLRTLAKAAERVGEGDLEIAIPTVKTRDEVGRLSESFSQMVTSLQDYIQKLTETTAAKERIESELKIAHDIQLSIVPRMFPPFPDRKEFEIFAVLKPAREVGGDYYDFFFLDDDHLCFTIGDVSGKGVPASLYMAVTRTLIRAKAAAGLSPAQVMDRVNQDLAMDNLTSMFVTIFLGIFDVREGIVRFCNGGHDPPILIDSAGEIKAMGEPDGLLVGVISDTDYHTHEYRMEIGETVFLFTDGITEAMDPREELYTRERLEDYLKRFKSPVPEKLIREMLEELERYAAGHEQSDDITMLALKYLGDGE